MVKIVEKHRESEPSSVCIICCNIDNEQIKKCGEQAPKCIICAGTYIIEKHQCGVNRYNKRREKTYVHIFVK